MRDILFRGKRCDNGEWAQGYYIRADHHWHKNGIHKDWITLGASANGGWLALHNKYAVKAETLGQFTGLTDKNGKKVFDGDICKVCLDPEICVGKVIWDDKIASYNILFNDGKCILPLDLWLNRNNPVWIEVIGNIHDNPELLEVSEDGH